jgi:Spy/CpxP family protein refolding chaperone
MEHDDKRKWQIRAAILGIFLLGFLAGALTLHAYHKRVPQVAGEGRRDRFAQMLDRLDLTADQRARVEQIMKEARSQMIEVHKQPEPRIVEIRKQTDERLQAVLTPRQWEQWQREMRGRRRRGASR